MLYTHKTIKTDFANCSLNLVNVNIPSNRSLFKNEYKKIRFYNSKKIIKNNNNLNLSLLFLNYKYLKIKSISEKKTEHKKNLLLFVRKLERITKNQYITINNISYKITKRDIKILITKNKLNSKLIIILNHFLSGKYTNQKGFPKRVIRFEGYEYKLLKNAYFSLNPILEKKDIFGINKTILEISNLKTKRIKKEIKNLYSLNQLGKQKLNSLKGAI